MHTTHSSSSSSSSNASQTRPSVRLPASASSSTLIGIFGSTLSSTPWSPGVFLLVPRPQLQEFLTAGGGGGGHHRLVPLAAGSSTCAGKGVPYCENTTRHFAANQLPSLHIVCGAAGTPGSGSTAFPLRTESSARSIEGVAARPAALSGSHPAV